MWFQDNPAWHDGQAWWNSERRIRAARPGVGTGHLPDAEIHWPSLPGSRYAGQVWAVEIELTPKAAARTGRIIAGLLSPQYAQVIYLCAPAARLVVARTAAGLPPDRQARITIRDLPPAALTPEGPAL